MRIIARFILKLIACIIPSKTLRHKVRNLVPRENSLTIKFTDAKIQFLKDNEKYYPNNILSPDETIYDIINNNKSCARIGDGEFLVMLGWGNVWGNNDSALAQRLLNICQTGSTEKCLVCINKYGLYNTSRWFCFYNFKTIKKITECIKFNHSNMYGDAYAFLHYSIEFIHYELLGRKRKREARIRARNLIKIKQIWDNKNIVFVVNKKSLCIADEMNIFNCCTSKNYVFVPEKNSYAEYDRILSKIRQYPTNYIIYLECGETATVLAWDLSQLGYQALDIGSLYTRLKEAESTGACTNGG